MASDTPAPKRARVGSEVKDSPDAFVCPTGVEADYGNAFYSKNSEDLKRFYDESAKAYDNVSSDRGWAVPDHVAALVALQAFNSDSPKIALLDTGCGPGSFGESLQKVVKLDRFCLSGCDLSPELLKTASERHKYRGGLQEVDMRVMPWPYESESFDFVTWVGCSKHLTHAPDIYREFARVTKPGGHIVTQVRSDSIDSYEGTMKQLQDEGVVSMVLKTAWLKVYSCLPDDHPQGQVQYTIIIFKKLENSNVKK